LLGLTKLKNNSFNKLKLVERVKRSKPYVINGGEFQLAFSWKVLYYGRHNIGEGSLQMSPLWI
jgi:hypothetical protein